MRNEKSHCRAIGQSGAKEEEAKELTVQVEALEIVVTALLRHMAEDAQQRLIQDIETAMEQVKPGPLVDERDTQLLQQYIKSCSGILVTNLVTGKDAVIFCHTTFIKSPSFCFLSIFYMETTK